MKNMISIDRLSSLPDDLIFNILSFLPTKTSVATSILAKRWRFLWAHVPNIDLDSDDHRFVKFSDIMCEVLSLHRAHSINTFCLRFTDTNCGDEFGDWIKAIAARNVRKIDITLDFQVMVLPMTLFLCETLVDLRLFCCGEIPYGDRVSLPALKRLHLDNVNYGSDESLPYLLKCCPVLEELIVDRLVSEPDPKKACFNVTSYTLKKLVIRSISDNKRYAYSLRLMIPSLRYLLLKDSVSTVISAQRLLSLTEANINLRNKAPKGGNEDYSLSVLNFIRTLSNVRCLNLSTCLLKGSVSALSATPTKFCNLTTLKLGTDWGFVSYFLENADNLEVLTINKGCKGKKRWVEPCQVPPCLISRLKTVRIKGFRGTEIEFEVTRYVLANAKVLKRMVIYQKQYQLKAVERISNFDRGSKACRLVFH